MRAAPRPCEAWLRHDGANGAHHERLGLVQRITRRDPVRFGSSEWLMPDQVDETYWRLLPTGSSEITAEEQRELAVIFGEGGEMAAERLI